MPHFSDYDVVRVIRLINPNRPYEGTEGISRPPRIGDTGTIVFNERSGIFQVESVDRDGLTVWLAEFHDSELEHAQRKVVE